MDARIPTLILVASVLLGVGAILIALLPRTRWGDLQRRVAVLPKGVAITAGTVLAMSVLSGAQWMGLGGLGLAAAGGVSVGVLVWVGLYLPNIEQRQHKRRRHRLVFQCLHFAGYLQNALEYEGDIALIRNYLARPLPALRDLQDLLAQALHAQENALRGNIWGRIAEVMEDTRSREAITLAAALSTIAQYDRSAVVTTLEQIKHTISATLRATYEQRANKNTNILLLATALSLIGGFLISMLYLVTGGFTLVMLPTG